MFDFDATCAFGLEAVWDGSSRPWGWKGCATTTVTSFSAVTSWPWLAPTCGPARPTASGCGWGLFPATTFEEVFQGTRSLPWADLLPVDAEFPVEGLSHGSPDFFSVPALQSVTKKAVVEALAIRYGAQTFPENGPRFPIRVALAESATISLDAGGVGLHKRGYRLARRGFPFAKPWPPACFCSVIGKPAACWSTRSVAVAPFCWKPP